MLLVQLIDSIFVGVVWANGVNLDTESIAGGDDFFCGRGMNVAAPHIAHAAHDAAMRKGSWPVSAGRGARIGRLAFTPVLTAACAGLTCAKG